MNQSFLFFELIGVFIVHWLLLEPQTYVVVEQFGAENIPLLSGRLVFNPHELAKIVLESSTKFYGVELNHLPSELNQKGFSVLSRNIQYQARLKGPLPVFFRHCGTFFEKFFSTKGSTLQFFDVLR